MKPLLNLIAQRAKKLSLKVTKKNHEKIIVSYKFTTLAMTRFKLFRGPCVSARVFGNTISASARGGSEKPPPVAFKKKQLT